jgi:mevalonate kinase
VAVSAHGKVILLGEHAVVYGVPALCGALRSGVTITSQPGDGALVVPAWGVRAYPDPSDGGKDLARAYAAILRALRLDAQVVAGTDFVARFDIPTSAGLGSSAALSVALARAVCEAAAREQDPAAIAEAALRAEEVFHGRPSGLDHTVAQQGGFGLFRRGQGLVPLAAPALPLCIGMTGRARDTRGRVARVAALHEEAPAMTGACFARIRELVERGAAAVSGGDLPMLGAAMNDNQEILGRLEVSCPEIEHMCRLAREAGALGAKLTGGGGGGCVIALSPGNEEAVRRRWAEAGYDSLLTTVGGAA